MNRSSQTQIVMEGAIYLTPFAIMFWLIINHTNQGLIYTLDDPYIHLALAKNIWIGSYGINPNEMSAPSSSIIWPFLLSPFAAFNFFELIPLIINCLCVVLSGLLIASTLKTEPAKRTLISLSLMFSTNLFGLAFTGMEHSLQTLLCIIIAKSILETEIEKTDKSRIFLYFSLVILPMVRYEGLAISIPVFIYLYFNNKKAIAVTLSLSTIAFLSGFSFFLYKNNLGLIPSSILAKADQGTDAIWNNFSTNLVEHGPLLAGVISLSFFLKSINQKKLALITLTSTCMHFTFGKFGWFSRYEAYLAIFILIIAARVLLISRPSQWKLLLISPIAFSSLCYATIKTPIAAANIYNQQAQIAKIAEILGKPVAVNDLGLMSLRSGQYILDLWGLGSREALELRKTSSNAPYWIAKLMKEKSVNFAFIYDEWFPYKPTSWIKVGFIKLDQERVTPASDKVFLYATSPESAEELVAALKTYARMPHPKETVIVSIAAAEKANQQLQ